MLCTTVVHDDTHTHILVSYSPQLPAKFHLNRYRPSHEGQKKLILPYFERHHSMVVPSSGAGTSST